jgi:hypothetical protein
MSLPASTRSALILASVMLATFLVAVAVTLLPFPVVAAQRGVMAQLVLAWLLIAASELAAMALAALLVHGGRIASP